MKKHFKKIGLLLLAVATVTTLVACGNNSRKNPFSGKYDNGNASDSDILIGLLYDIGQDASTTPIADAKKILDQKNIAYKEYTGTTVDEVSMAVDSAISDNVDAIFTPTDNTIMTAELSIYEKLANAGIPHFTGADSFALNGAFLGYGVDYAELGRDTAEMIEDVLIEKENISTLEVETFDNGTATINTETADMLGINTNELESKIRAYCEDIKYITTANEFEDPIQSLDVAKLQSEKVGNTSSNTVFKIGICNYVDDASLNQIAANLKVELDEIGREENVAFDIKYDNANADTNVLNQIISDFEASKVDLMVGIATPVAMSMQSATEKSNTPVIFAAVSDPVSTGLVSSLERPGANISGSSDYLDTRSIINLMLAAIQ